MLGSQFVILAKDMLTSGIMWGVGCILWLVLIYTIFSRLMVKRDKPSIDAGINGTWLVAVVATQSISILGTTIPSARSIPTREA